MCVDIQVIYEVGPSDAMLFFRPKGGRDLSDTMCHLVDFFYRYPMNCHCSLPPLSFNEK